MSDSILFIGSAMADILCPVDELPKSGGGAVANDVTMSLGGCASNSAHAARSLGADCRLLVPIGYGPYASFISSELKERGFSCNPIDTQYDNGACICMIEPNGERTMITIPGIERHFERSWFDSVDANEYAYAEFCGYEVNGASGDAILAFLESNPHLQVFFAPGPVIMKIEPDKLERIEALKATWHLNKMEALAFTKTDNIHDAGMIMANHASAAIITDGENGSHAFASGKHWFAKSMPVTPVDTIGAGDSHIGALLAMRASGADWQDSLEAANAYSAKVCMVSGATL